MDCFDLSKVNCRNIIFRVSFCCKKFTIAINNIIVILYNSETDKLIQLSESVKTQKGMSRKAMEATIENTPSEHIDIKKMEDKENDRKDT